MIRIASQRHFDRFCVKDPDVVLIGEMRDLETIQAALTVAETGRTWCSRRYIRTRRRSRLTVLLTCFRRINSHRFLVAAGECLLRGFVRSGCAEN